MDKENSSHAAGMGTDWDGTRQRNQMGTGKGAMKGSDFGVGELPGSARIKGDTGMMGKELSDKERAGGPAMRAGDGRMRMTSNSDHGPHR